MSMRIEAGSDIAQLGAWDAAVAALPENANGELQEKAIEEASANAELFIIETGADGTDTVDVFVDETPTASQLQGFRQAGEERLLRISSGRMRIDGLEYYRADQKNAPPGDLVAVPPGNYGIICWVNTNEEGPPGTEARETFRSVVGDADYDYYRKIERRTHLGCWSILLFPLLGPALGWKLSLAIAVFVVIAWSHVRERMLKRDARYQAIMAQHQEFIRRTAAAEPATLILVLRRLTEPGGLQGGTVRLER